MRSTTSNKQNEILKPSNTLIYHCQDYNQYSTNSIDNKERSIKIKLNDANNNEDCSTMMAIVTNPTVTNKVTNASAPCRSKNEKYSLRQRQKRLFNPSCPPDVPIMHLQASANSVNTMSYNKNNSITSISKRTNNTIDQMTPIPKEKAKNKAAPLSKYRRKTANARERTRMREINSAFENLRRCVPHAITGDESASSNEKLTKITTLRLAMKYIQILSEALDNPAFQEDFLLECKNDGDHRFTTMDWVQPASIPSEEEVQVSPTAAAQTRCKVKKSKLPASKTSNRRQRTKMKVPALVSPHLISTSPLSSSLSSSSSSAYASMSTSPLLEDLHSTTDLSGMILESDGESLHLSEPCLSPLNQNYNLGMQSSPLNEMEAMMRNTPMSVTADNPLELSLKLLESDSDSLEFSTDQQTSTCISPLAILEAFNPFGDLLHSEFPEHTSLDLFLT